MGAIGEIDSPSNMKIIVNKLPFHMQDAWVRIVDGLQHDKYKRDTVRDLVSFIEKEARIANHPVLGKASRTKEQEKSEV